MNLASNNIVDLLWTQAWQLAVLTAIVALVVKLACCRRPHLAYLLWMLVVVKALTPPVWSSPTGLFSWALAEQTVAATTPPPAFHAIANDTQLADTPATTTSAERQVARDLQPTTTPARSLNVGLLLALVWAAGAGLFATVTVVRWLRMKRLLRHTSEPVDPALARHFSVLARRIGLRRNARLILTSAPLGPAAVGWWPGAVVLPVALVRAKTLEELTPILAHELVHLRRWDTMAGSVQLFAQWAWWFHPAAWWANRQARAERERCCDEEVVAELACPPADYARTLVDILEWRHRLPGTALPWPAMRAWDVTSERLRSLLEHAHPFRRRGPAWCWPVLVASAAIVLPGAGLQLIAAPPGAPAGKEIKGPMMATGVFVTSSVAPVVPGIGLEPTAEQRAVIEELEQLGLNVHWGNYRRKPLVTASFNKAFQPLDKPLPLEKLPGIQHLDVNRSRQSDEFLDAQLRALKNLRPETTLELSIQGDQAKALNRLAEIPGLARLTLLGKLPPLQPPGSRTGRTLRLNGLKGLKMLLVDSQIDGIQVLRELEGLTGLEELYVHSNFTDASLAPLATLTSLKFLSITSTPPAATLDAPWLAPLVHIERLTLGQPTSDAAMPRIAGLKNLKLLALDTQSLTDRGLAQLASLKELRVLHLYNNSKDSKLGPTGYRTLASLVNLRSLSVSGPTGEAASYAINDDVLAAWQTLVHLRSIGLRCDVGDRGMAALAALPKLRSVSLHGDIHVTDKAKSLSLECRSLYLSIPDVTNGGMSQFGRLTNLVALGLNQAKHIDAEGLAALEPLKNLETLSLQEAKLNGPAAAALAKFEKLKKLYLDQCQLGDDALAAIAKLKHLETLHLAHTGVADDQLKSLAALTSLKELDLTSNPISDAGLDELRSLKSLRALQVAGGNTTEAGRSRLALAIPRLEVDVSGVLSLWGTSFVAWDDELMDDPASP